MNPNLNIKKLRVSLEYSSNTVSLEVEPYRQIKFLKEKAAKIFYPLNYELKLIYANKDLTPYDNVSLGDFFKNKNTVHIKLIQIVNLNAREERTIKGGEVNDYYMKNNLGNRKNENYGYFNNSPSSNNYNIIKSYKDNLVNSPNFLNNNPSHTKINVTFPDKYILCSCSNDMIGYYCRNCGIFLCKGCRMNSLHKLHNSLHIDVDNLEESLKLYAITLQADINLNLKAGKNYQKNFQTDKFVDPSSRKEIIIRKLNEIERRQESMIAHLPEINQNEINSVLADYEIEGQKAQLEIEEILDKLYTNFSKKKKKLSFENVEKYFELINSREKQMEEVSYSIMAYKYNYQVHKKIDEMYKIIERAIDAVLNSEVNEIHSEIDYSSIIALGMIKSKKNTVQKERDNSRSKDNSISKDRIILEKDKEKNSNNLNTNANLDIKKNNIVNFNNNRIAIEAIDKDDRFNITRDSQIKNVHSQNADLGEEISINDTTNKDIKQENYLENESLPIIKSNNLEAHNLSISNNDNTNHFEKNHDIEGQNEEHISNQEFEVEKDKDNSSDILDINDDANLSLNKNLYDQNEI